MSSLIPFVVVLIACQPKGIYQPHLLVWEWGLETVMSWSGRSWYFWATMTHEVGPVDRRHRHLPVKEQHAALKRRINGHFIYFGVNGNLRSLRAVIYWTTRIWRKWLGRRSQRARIDWARMNDLLWDFPLPVLKVRTQIW